MSKSEEYLIDRNTKAAAPKAAALAAQHQLWAREVAVAVEELSSVSQISE